MSQYSTSPKAGQLKNSRSAQGWALLNDVVEEAAVRIIDGEIPITDRRRKSARPLVTEIETLSEQNSKYLERPSNRSI